MKKICFIFFTLFLAGCGGSLSTTWNNFSAYYNTFYNAKKEYRAGIRKVVDQPVRLAPRAVVRPHPAPVNAGDTDFEQAIRNGALVLRRHAGSKWTDNALLLIGKSYYYQQKFFQAVQMFEQLIDSPQASGLKQEAVLWKGRALLDIGSYGEGIRFLESQLAATAGRRDPALTAEIKVMLAEHYAMMDEWEKASRVLEPAILRLKDEKLKGRSYVLLGQTLENAGDLNRAFQAYSNVPRFYPDYEYVYWANIKRADVMRRLGNTGLAASIYKDMLNDDKNGDRRNTILFELARTYEKQGQIERAEEIYKRILKQAAVPSSILIADTYYRLGQLYSREYGNFRLAAAYYDSSSSAGNKSQRTAADAPGLSSAYGQYLELKARMSGIDSLLWLGSLNPRQRDSVLAQVRSQRTRETRIRPGQGGDLMPNDALNGSLEAPNAAETSGFGFLNYRNARMVAASRQQFRTRWGNRPLVDNWRRTDAIRSISGAQERSRDGTDKKITTGSHFTDQQLGIDLSDIPMTPQAASDLRNRRLRLQYQVGNLFFLTLNQPDSAKYYFQQVVRNSADAPVKPKALYSLYRLYEAERKSDSLAFYRKWILQEYPLSVYASRVSDLSGYRPLPSDSIAVLRQKVHQLLADSLYASPRADRAEQLRKLAMRHRSSPLAPAVFHAAIKEYIRLAKVSSSDTARTHEGATPGIGDRTAGRYRGKYWDRVRDLNRQFLRLFPKAPEAVQVQQWMQTLAEDTGTNLTCREANITPRVQPDMDTFMEAVRLPGNIRDLRLSGTITYRLIINPEGGVESYKLLSKPSGLGIEQAYEHAIKKRLKFEPVIVNNQPVTISCRVAFPIKQ